MIKYLIDTTVKYIFHYSYPYISIIASTFPLSNKYYIYIFSNKIPPENHIYHFIYWDSFIHSVSIPILWFSWFECLIFF